MRNHLSAFAFALLLTVSPVLAAPPHAELPSVAQAATLPTSPGEIEVIARDGHQFLKFSDSFAVSSAAEAEVRHVDRQTGKTTFIGRLVSPKGYQVYEVPDGLTVDSADQIVVYSPLKAEDLATIDLR